MYRGLWVVWLAACAGDGKDGANTADTADTDVPAATFTRVKTEILEGNCALSGCHTSTGTTNNLVLDAGGEYAALVNAPSVAAPGEVLVIPGDADASYVVLKLEDGIGIVGSPMPPPFGGLSEEKITLMRDWIDAGALDN